MSNQTANVGLDIDDVGTAAALTGLTRTRIGGAGALALGVASTARNVIANGRIDQASLLSTASSAATMIGMRLIPGVGWAATAYTVADLGSRAFLGKPFGETMVGKPIDWAIDKAGRGGIAAATGALDLVGWKGGSDFLRNTIYPWAYPEAQGEQATPEMTAEERAAKRVEDARHTGLLPMERNAPVLLRGADRKVSAADTTIDQPEPSVSSPPLKNGAIDLDAMAASPLGSAVPHPELINERRVALLLGESSPASPGIEQTGLEGRRSSSLAEAVSAEASIVPAHTASKAPAPVKPIGRSYDE
ncbi:MAG: hypothetical protein DI537_05470 [Stutzerimonas stutzeri]|nr:MAG: hypothetical protein DI537_05470 [Stutzerimonas stutzeri]